MVIADRLKAAMAANGIKKSELARRCGVSPPTVTYWLSGATTVLKGQNLLKAASALNVSAHWLETGLGEMSAPRHLTHDQDEILTIMVELDENNQHALLLMARSLRQSQDHSAPSAVSPFKKHPSKQSSN